MHDDKFYQRKSPDLWQVDQGHRPAAVQEKPTIQAKIMWIIVIIEMHSPPLPPNNVETVFASADIGMKH